MIESCAGAWRIGHPSCSLLPGLTNATSLEEQSFTHNEPVPYSELTCEQNSSFRLRAKAFLQMLEA
jgi:hypothetical protein